MKSQGKKQMKDNIDYLAGYRFSYGKEQLYTLYEALTDYQKAYINCQFQMAKFISEEKPGGKIVHIAAQNNSNSNNIE